MPVLLVAIAAAGALKWHYHSATSAELAWILAPTAALVNLVTGAGFSFDETAGFRTGDGSFTIAPACAGVNFLIISFCMLVFMHARLARRVLAGFAVLLGCGAVAYGATLLANTARIALSIRSAQPAAAHAWIGYDAIHRIEGVSIYFLSLSVLYIAAHMAGTTAPRRAPDAGPPLRTLSLAVPLFWYLLVTLGIPVLRMSFRGDFPGFIEHGLYVVLIPTAAVLGFTAVKRVLSRVWRMSAGKRLAAAAVVLVLPGLAYGLWEAGPAGDTPFNHGRNGLWLGQKWYTGAEVSSGTPVPEGEVEALLATLAIHGVRYAYPFAGPITPAGTLDNDPTTFFLDLQSRAPDVLFLPWISGKSEELPLDHPAWRARVIQTLGRLHASGINGVHLDIEPIRDGHPGYTELLQEIRDRFDGHFFVSHATRRVAPFGRAAGALRNHFWSSAFYADTMRASDQTVLMGYNTLLDSPRLYRAYMSHQTGLLLQCAAAVPNHQVLIGIPSYDDVPRYSNPAVENIQNAVWGVRHALERYPGNRAHFEGLSLFAEWTTSPEEWSTFQSTWR